MTRDELVCGLKKRLVDQATHGYKTLIFDPQSSASAKLFGEKGQYLIEGLTIEQKNTLLSLIEQIEVDTVADFLAFLDGAYWLEGQAKDPVLFIEDTSEKLNVDLSDRFLSLIHKWDR